jgi:hypothetical protein
VIQEGCRTPFVRCTCTVYDIYFGLWLQSYNMDQFPLSPGLCFHDPRKLCSTMAW